MASSEQSIRISAKGEFGQLQRGLKDLQGDLKNVVGEIDKGARKGGVFSDSDLRALDLFKRRAKEAMEGVNRELDRHNNQLDKLYEKSDKASGKQKQRIEDQIKAREKELDVIRKQLIAQEEMYRKRTSEADEYQVLPGKGGKGGGEPLIPAALSGMLGKAGGIIGTVSKFALGLAGLSSIVALGQKSYQLAYQREVESLDLSQRIRGSGFSGTNRQMYDQVKAIGMRDNMGYGAQESWAVQEAYTRHAGSLGADGQFDLQKFARGYGIDATEAASTFGNIKQLGGMVQPKEFADMIAGSVSQSGMLPRIHEVMQAHTGLLQNLNTTFKDGSSRQILAYQTLLDKLGNESGMTRLTGAQGANIIGGLGGVFQPGNDKWKWTGVAALQNYDREKYGSMGLYDLESSFEQGLLNPDNLPAMSNYLREQSGGNTEVFKRLMQSWLTDGGFGVTKGQVSELYEVTNGFTAFNKSDVDKVMGINDSTDSGAKYDVERANEYGQNILQVEAKFDDALAEVGREYLLKPITELKSDFTNIVNTMMDGGSLGDIWKAIDDSNGLLKGILAAVAVSAGVSVIKTGADIASIFKRGRTGGGRATKAASEVAEEASDILKGKTGKATSATGEVQIGKNIKSSGLTKAENEALEALSKGNPANKKAFEQIYRSTGDMDAVKKAASGNMTSGELADILSNGNPKAQAEIAKHLDDGDISGAFKKAEDFAKNADELIHGGGTRVATEVGEELVESAGKKSAGGFFSKIAKGAGEKTLQFFEKLGRGVAATGKGAGKVLSKAKVPIIGGLIDFGINKLLMGQSTEEAATRAIGSGLGGAGGAAGGAALGGVIGGGVGALFGGVGAIPGAAIGSWIGGLGGGIGGGMLGDKAGSKAFDFFSKRSEDKKRMGDAAQELLSFAYKGNLAMEGFSAKGLAKLEELRDKGLLQFVETKSNATATLMNFSEDGKSRLLELQNKGLIAIGGLQENGTAKITALSNDGKTYLEALRDEGIINITDFNESSKIEISSLSEEGAKELIKLQENGSGTFTSMDATTAKKLQEMKTTMSDRMNDIKDEHKSFVKTIGSFFTDIGTKVEDWWKSLWGKGDKGLGSASGSYDVRKMSDVSSKDLDKTFGGVLTGHGYDFIKAGKKYGIDPAFLAAISMHETGNGTSFAAQNFNNIGGMMGKNGLLHFGSIEEGIDAMAKNLKNLYIDQGLYTPESIQKKYAPIGADNDPLGLNDNWLSGVLNFYRKFGGSGDSSIGRGSFFDGWQNRVTSEFGEWRGDHGHGGLDIDGTQGDRIGALANGKIAFINMDDGGKYDDDGKKNTRAGGTEIGIKMPNGEMYYYSHLSKVNPDLLDRYMKNGDADITAGNWIGDIGGDRGVAGSGYSTTGSHLHMGYLDKNGNPVDPRKLLNSMSSGDSSIGTSEEWNAALNGTRPSIAGTTSEVKISVDVNLKGEGVSQLNGMTVQALQSLIEQTVTSIQRKKLAMNPTARGG